MLAADGEAYRDARIEQARRSGVADSVCFDTGYRNVSMLTDLIQSAAVVVLPYDSTDQVTSGVLVDAIASGRPVVATAFPHAVELLGSGAGIVVGHDDPDALASALRRVLTQPRPRRRHGGRGSPIGARDGLAGRRERLSEPGAAGPHAAAGTGMTAARRRHRYSTICCG